MIVVGCFVLFVCVAYPIDLLTSRHCLWIWCLPFLYLIIFVLTCFDLLVCMFTLLVVTVLFVLLVW